MAAHKQLEELVLDRATMEVKKDMGNKLAQIVYEGKWFTPLCDAVKAFVESTQEYVTGEVKIQTVQGQHHQSRNHFSILLIQRVLSILYNR